MDQLPLETGRIHIIVNGRVQGVGFRAFVKHSAEELGLSGWVRNIGFRQVETIAEGKPQILKRFLELVLTGPLGARVKESNFNWEMPLGDFTSFEVRYK
jgi:acylphosphatase